MKNYNKKHCTSCGDEKVREKFPIIKAKTSSGRGHGEICLVCEGKFFKLVSTRPFKVLLQEMV